MDGEDEIVEMDRMRKLIADHMVRSVQTSPHVTSFVEADVTRIVDWRNRNKSAFQAQTGQKLTFTPFFIEAVAKALREFPGVNASVDGDRIILKKGHSHRHGGGHARGQPHCSSHPPCGPVQPQWVGHHRQ